MQAPETDWIYATNATDTARYVLGTVGERPLVCVGVNPSTGQPGEYNGTLRAAQRMAQRHGFDSWVMINLYPQRTVDPNRLHRRWIKAWHQENLAAIAEVLGQGSPTLWAAWGTLIAKRPYLLRCLQDIASLPQAQGLPWITLGQRSKQGHPHHPLYLPNSALPESFAVQKYLASR